MIAPKTDQELDLMREGGRKLGLILEELTGLVQPDVRLSDIEKHACDLIKKAGGTPSFKTVKGYSWATCICINEEVVHGIPTDYQIRDGDVVTVDIGMVYHGYHTDTADTIFAGRDKNVKVNDFFSAGRSALAKAISASLPGNRIFDISMAIENTVSDAGYSVVKSLVGHGIGKSLHEPPQIPCFTSNKRESTMELKKGMTIAIEVIYAEGGGDVVYGSDDGWTISTSDGTLSAVFEHTIAVNQNPEILTLRPGELKND